jgi:hypothetical protein
MADLKDPKAEDKPEAKPADEHGAGLMDRFHGGRMEAPKCPQCEGKTERYEGDNPHKQGSYECPRCKLRVRQG